METGYSAADLHIHTTLSDGTATPAEVVDWVAEETDLKVIAICDHNTNEGALAAASYAARSAPDLGIVVGQEVESSDGHILGLWTPALIVPGMTAEATVAEIHRQGGLALAAHPYAPRWWKNYGLCRGDTEVYDCAGYDGVEVANSTPLLFFANFRARRYWRGNAYRLCATGGSDAHMLSVIGTSRTLFPGSNAADFRHALETRATLGWGPSLNPVRSFSYARKVREIQERDRQSRARMSLTSSQCDGCDGCDDQDAVLDLENNASAF